MIYLPTELFHEIDSFLNSRELFKLRQVNQMFKSQVEDYGDKNIVKRKQFGLIRDWQLLFLKTECYGLKEQIYNPIKCKNHIGLLKFISRYPEFDKLFNELKRDVGGFLKPMILYYKKRIHELDKFVEIFDCKYYEENYRECLYFNNNNNNNDELGSFLLLIAGIRCLQG